jgi:hypothetical protein
VCTLISVPSQYWKCCHAFLVEIRLRCSNGRVSRSVESRECHQRYIMIHTVHDLARFGHCRASRKCQSCISCSPSFTFPALPPSCGTCPSVMVSSSAGGTMATARRLQTFAASLKEGAHDGSVKPVSTSRLPIPHNHLVRKQKHETCFRHQPSLTLDDSSPPRSDSKLICMIPNGRPWADQVAQHTEVINLHQSLFVTRTTQKRLYAATISLAIAS